MEKFLPIFHYISIIILFGLLFVEFYLSRLEISKSQIKTLARVDILYGIFSGVVILSGILRVVLSKIGSNYYSENGLFWVKIILFLILGILSIPPSIKFFKWSKQLKTDDSLPQAAEMKKAQLFIHIELAIFIGIVVFAVLMAY